jgi:FixJ family two-component response regulator
LRRCAAPWLSPRGLNKQVVADLGISEITVNAYRGQAMRKMKARSLADLVHMAAKIESGRFLS